MVGGGVDIFERSESHPFVAIRAMGVRRGFCLDWIENRPAEPGGIAISVSSEGKWPLFALPWGGICLSRGQCTATNKRRSAWQTIVAGQAPCSRGGRGGELWLATRGF